MGVLSGTITAKILKVPISRVDKDSIDTGKKAVEKYQHTKTESKKVADIKSRVTGRKENGKPGFLMSEQEHKEFYARYEQRRKALSEQYKNATTDAAKRRIRDEADRLEGDFMDIVEQDFWYRDDFDD